MNRFGISIYPNLFSVEDTIAYIDLAHKYGFNRIFTNFIEIESQEDIDKFVKILNYAKERGFFNVVDVNPAVFGDMGFTDEQAIEFFHKMGAHALRMDEEFDGLRESKMTYNKYGMKLELNSSATTGILEKMIEHKANLENVISCHNFYPQRYSALSTKLFLEKCDYYRQHNIQSAAFVHSQNPKARGPWPITEGMPTVEYHREWSMVDQFKDLIALGKIDDIIISNQPASEAEFKQVSKLCKDGFNFTITLVPEVTELERKTLFEADTERFGRVSTLDVRQDYNDYMIRCSAPRSKYNNQPIAPRKLKRKFFEPGDVLVLNNLYDRYNGEVQIVMQQIDYDEKKNFLGTIDKNDLKTLQYISPSKKITFIEND